jgi:hypothetical protein
MQEKQNTKSARLPGVRNPLQIDLKSKFATRHFYERANAELRQAMRQNTQSLTNHVVYSLINPAYWTRKKPYLALATGLGAGGALAFVAANPRNTERAKIFFTGKKKKGKLEQVGHFFKNLTTHHETHEKKIEKTQKKTFRAMLANIFFTQALSVAWSAAIYFISGNRKARAQKRPVFNTTHH